MSGVADWKKNEDGWTAVDALIESSLLGDDPVLAATLVRSREAGLPDIAVSPAQGKLLQLLAQMSGAKAILEIGTLGGYSTICLARGAGEGGKVTTLEIDRSCAEVARANLAAADLPAQAEVLTGPALDSLADLPGPFDLSFIDADKVNNAAYVDKAVGISKPGALVIVDNVVREGKILDPALGDESAVATRALYDHVRNHPRLDATAIQTVGSKGWDGFLIARVTS